MGSEEPEAEMSDVRAEGLGGEVIIDIANCELGSGCGCWSLR